MSHPEKLAPADADILQRIAAALERLAPQPPKAPDFAAADAFIWFPDARKLSCVPRVNRVDIPLAHGKAAADYQVMIGFQLTHEQVDYNRQTGQR